jgi:hypothetical protein
MAQTHDGALKILAARIGTTPAEVAAKRTAGFKWCWKCAAWRGHACFGSDPSRGDGLTVYCLSHRRVTIRKPWRPRPNPLTGRPGPAPHPFRDGDKVQARARVHLEVHNGRMPSADNVPCTQCGHIWKTADPHHHYHHHRGYDTEHHLDVIVLCASCHGRTHARHPRSHCKNGHALSGENVVIENQSNGPTRRCRRCRSAYERKRRGADYWREYRKKRGERAHG